MRGLTRQTDEVLDMLHEAGYKAYIVGGCVRDMLMGKEPEDYDITTSARPEAVSYTHLDVYKRQYMVLGPTLFVKKRSPRSIRPKADPAIIL